MFCPAPYVPRAVTGFVTPRMRELAVDLGGAVLRHADVRRAEGDRGRLGRVEELGESRWSLSGGIGVVTDSTGAVPVRTPSASVAATSWNWPRNVEMPLCLIAKPKLLWTGSTLYVPAPTC